MVDKKALADLNLRIKIWKKFLGRPKKYMDKAWRDELAMTNALADAWADLRNWKVFWMYDPNYEPTHSDHGDADYQQEAESLANGDLIALSETLVETDWAPPHWEESDIVDDIPPRVAREWIDNLHGITVDTQGHDWFKQRIYTQRTYAAEMIAENMPPEDVVFAYVTLSSVQREALDTVYPELWARADGRAFDFGQLTAEQLLVLVDTALEGKYVPELLPR